MTLCMDKRTRSVQNCMPTQSIGTIVTNVSFRTLQRGNAFRDALRRQEDAERPELHADAEHRHDSYKRLVPHAPAWECLS